MMPDLGKYAAAVLSSYAVSLALLAVLVWVSVRRARRVKAELDKVEMRDRSDG
ncbi:MAG: heme exporter protein CcmD [Rhodobacteraceae bacterium]|nr:heme exporter protein CcmD [Paracoccaceae bacterium]